MEFQGDYTALSQPHIDASHGRILISFNGILLWADVTEVIALALGLGAADDGAQLEYSHALGKIIKRVGPLWTPNNSPSARYWHKCFDDTAYTKNGSNVLLTSTNKIDLFTGSYNISSVDSDGVLAATGVGARSGWRFMKNLSGFAVITNGVYIANPGSFCIGTVFSLEASQLTGGLDGGNVFSVANLAGEDIKVWARNYVTPGPQGQVGMILTIRYNTVYAESTTLLLSDVVYLLCMTYDGTTATLWLNGYQLLAITVGPAGVGMSDLMLGAQGVNQGEWGNNFNLGGFIYDFAMLSTHATDERQKLEGYFAHQHALLANLPGSHPYKTAQPNA